MMEFRTDCPARAARPASRSRRWLLWIGLVLLPALALSADLPSQTTPKVISQDEIQRALAPKPKTRGITLRAKDAPRALVDLDIPFAFNSSDLQPAATAQLQQLGAALKTESLASSRFLITGHTDAKGRSEYNRALSLRRAETVQRYLQSHGVDRARLEVAGAGSDQLLRPEAPDDAVNRRVEIRNLGTDAQ